MGFFDRIFKTNPSNEPVKKYSGKFLDPSEHFSLEDTVNTLNRIDSLPNFKSSDDIDFFARKYGLKPLALLITVGLLGEIFLKYRPSPEAIQVACTQFLREELESLSEGLKYGNLKLHEDLGRKLLAQYSPSFYQGSLGETCEYPIDYGGGPQLTIIRICMVMMKNKWWEEDCVQGKLRILVINTFHHGFTLYDKFSDEKKTSLLTAYSQIKSLRP